MAIYWERAVFLAFRLCFVPFPFGVWGRVCNAIVSVPDHRGERGGSVVECRTPEREVRGSRPTAAVLCP